MINIIFIVALIVNHFYYKNQMIFLVRLLAPSR